METIEDKGTGWALRVWRVWGSNWRRCDPVEYRKRRRDKFPGRISEVARRFLGTNIVDNNRKEGFCQDQGDSLKDDKFLFYSLGYSRC